jgi:hypothetical protein
MNTSQQLAKHLRDVHFGGNWTSVNLKTVLAEVGWEAATAKVYSFNTIAALVYHVNYYVSVVSRVLDGEPLNAKDAYSFQHPPIGSPEDWQRMLDKTWSDAERFASLTEQLPDSQMEQLFIEEKYGTYYRNLQGIIEHTHYHLGQIVLIKKLLMEPGK